MLWPLDIPAIIIADVHGGLPVAKVLACALNPNVLSEATQKGDKIDSTIIPILRMGKPGLREELTGPNPGSLEVAKSGFEPKAVCCLLNALSHCCSRAPPGSIPTSTPVKPWTC